jgi:hypothetical protein
MKRPSVALAYSGDFRALDVVHTSVVHATDSLHGESVFFFWLERPQATARPCMRPRSESEKEGQHWTLISDAYVKLTVRQLYGAVRWHAASSRVDS